MSNLKIRPLHDRVVVQQLEAEKVSKGGIVLTGDSATKPHEGIVVAVGKGKYDARGNLVPVDVNIGDKVLFGQYVGQEAIIEGEELLILNEDEIIAILV